MSGRIGDLKTFGSGCVLSLVAPSAPMMLTVGRLVMFAVLYCGVSCDGREISRFACQKAWWSKSQSVRQDFEALVPECLDFKAPVHNC
jgi:hypothetical protein